MVVLFRLILLLIPIVALVLWLRWRSKRDLDDEAREAELKIIKRWGVVLVIALIGAGFGFRFLDDNSGDTDMVYVPARVDAEGTLIPGHYVSKEEAERAAEEAARTKEDDGG